MIEPLPAFRTHKITKLWELYTEPATTALAPSWLRSISENSASLHSTAARVHLNIGSAMDMAATNGILHP